MTQLKRILALLCCIVLLPVAAFADFSYDFDMTFQMDASKYPEEDQEMLVGVGDLLNMLRLYGNAATHDDRGGHFDIRFNFIIDEAEETITANRICGWQTSHWNASSDLLGDRFRLMLNNQALLEFGRKANDVLGLPLQYLAAAICPYTWEQGTELVRFFIHQMFFEKENTNVLDRDYVMSVANYLSENYADDYGFTSFVEALFSDSGMDEPINDFFDNLPDWIDELMGEGTLTIDKQEDGSFTIHTDDVTIFELKTQENGYSFVFDLPLTGMEWKVDADGTITDKSMNIKLKVVDDCGDKAINASIKLDNIPDAVPFEGTCTAEIKTRGYYFDEERTYKFALIGSGYDFDLMQNDAKTGDTMLTVHVSLKEAENFCSYFTEDFLTGENTIDILSINDSTLAEMVDTLKDTFTERLLPILAHIPATSYNALFTMLEDTGILDMLVPSSVGSSQHEDEEEGYEEDYEEEAEED